MTIKILGTGCKKCENLEKNARQAVANLGVNATVEKVEDYKKIMTYGVMQTPAIVIDEKVESYGKVLSVKEVEALITKL